MSIYYYDKISINIIVFPGAWSASFYIGNCIGPLIAGILVDLHGFRWSSQVFFFVFCFVIAMDIAVGLFEVTSRHDTQPKLRDSEPIQQNIAQTTASI